DLRTGIEECERTLGLFDILTSEDWQEGATWRLLDLQTQTRLAEDARELLLLLAWARTRTAPGDRRPHGRAGAARQGGGDHRPTTLPGAGRGAGGAPRAVGPGRGGRADTPPRRADHAGHHPGSLPSRHRLRAGRPARRRHPPPERVAAAEPPALLVVGAARH